MNWSLLLYSIMVVESGGCEDPARARGDLKDGHYRSVGAFQIQRAVVDDCNRVYPGVRFTYKDRESIERSALICRHYLAYWGNQYQKRTGKAATYEVLARIWNGGPYGYKKKATDPYWEKIRRTFESLEEGRKL